jgi:RHS repeat-associated core domain
LFFLTITLGNIGGRSLNQGYGEPDDVRKQYTGYERDKESGLDYAQARYYNSNHGRFTSVDPLTASANVKDPQSFNRYTYAMNSPYKFTDPLGLISSSTGACGQFCANSGGYVDGSAFRGRDASFDWSELSEPFAGGIQIAEGLSESQVKALVDAFSEIYETEGGYYFFNAFFDPEYNATLILDVQDLSSKDADGKTTWGLTTASRDADGHVTNEISARQSRAVSKERWLT